MKKIFLIVAVFSCLQTIAQKNSIGLSASSGLAYRIYQDKQGNLSEPIEMPKLGYTVTASYEHKFHAKASVFSGLSFISNGYQSQKRDILFSSPPPTTGFGAGYTAYRYRYSFYQIGIPVGVNYFIPIKKIKLFFSAGVSVNYLINVRYTGILYATDGNDRVSKRDDDKKYYKDFNFSAFASVGIEAKIAPKYNLRIFPNVSYNLTNVMDNAITYKAYLDATNIGVGVYRQL